MECYKIYLVPYFYVEYQSELLCKTFTPNAVLFVTKRATNVISRCECQL